MSKDIVIGYHGHCFDGMASAALLTCLLRELAAGDAQPARFRYVGLDHQPGGSHVPEKILTGEVNAVVDFRYTMSEKLTWWFDHHLSGLVGDAEREHFLADTSGRKFYEADHGSCSRLIADVARERFGVHLHAQADLVQWAHIIDTAGFTSAQMAVELAEPALQLMTVIEVHGDDAFLAPRIERLAQGTSVAELVAEPQVQGLLAPLLEHHRVTTDAIKTRAVEHAGVVHFDLAGLGNDRYNKFIPYWLYPSARYCVAVTLGRSRAKVSVGSNPWAPVPRTHNIAEICARYGGGGHAVVGAVSLKGDELERARTIAAEIVAELSR
ncbi:MAG: hypothetical protein RL701_7943 [Pseudomonadota bacterium]